MRETSSEVGAVDIELLLSGQVNVDAAGAIDFHSRSGKFFRNADGENVLTFAEYSWAGSKSTL